MLENGVRIPSLDGKDIYISNNLNKQKINEKGFPIGFRLRNHDGVLNLSRFVNTLDYSLDLIKMQDVFKKVYRDVPFSFYKNRKDFTQQVINVTFKYSVKEFNCIRNKIYVKLGYSYEDLYFKDHVAFDNGELVGIELGEDIESPISNELLGKYFELFEGKYRLKQKKIKNENSASSSIEIATVKTVAEIRENIYTNGFWCDGIKYVRFKRSAGSSRVGKCLFINEKLYNQMHKWEMCGIDVKNGQDIDLAALEPYIALTLSSIIDTLELNKENILVVKDYKSVFKDYAVATRFVDGRLKSKPEEVEICNTIWDGQSLMDRSVFQKFQERQRQTNLQAREHGMLLLRGRFFKSCCFNTNIQQWFADNGITDVSQLNGETMATKIEDIKLITTRKSIKYVKFGTLEQWLEQLEPMFGVVKYEKPTHFFEGRMVQTHYQLLNTLQMTYEEIEQFVQPSLNYAKLIKEDSAALRHQISYAYQTPDNGYYTHAVTSKNDVIYKLLGLNEQFQNTKMYREFCNDLLRSFIKNLRCGHILVRGNYSTICGNPIEMLKESIGKFDGTSVIEKDTVHSTNFEDGKELLGSRSPHVTIGNVLITRNVLRDEIKRYMNPTNEIVYINSIKDNILERLSGADFDSDTVMLTDNEILVQAAKRNYDHFPVPTKLVEAEERQRKYTDEEKADLDIKTSVNKIGEIINLSQELNSILWDRLYHGETIADVMDLYCDIAQLDVMSNLEIDSAKRENPANNTYELFCLKKKYDVRDKKNRHVRPLFFKYIDGYKGYRDKYYIYAEEENEFVKQGDTDSYREAQQIKKANSNIYIERGRMSYLKYHTSMDYLEIAIGKNFRIPDGRNRNKLLSDVLVEPLDEVVNFGEIKRLTDIATETKKHISDIWANQEYTNREKRELSQKVRVEFIELMQSEEVNSATVCQLLKDIEGEYKKIKRFMFYIMLDPSNYKMNKLCEEVLQNSSSGIYQLVEDEHGDIAIYDFNYRKELIQMPYDDQDAFRKFVNSFIEQYGLQVNWLADHVNYASQHFSSFLNGKKNLSKSKRIEIYRKIVEYRDRLIGF